jgi:hypothetical protein
MLQRGRRSQSHREFLAEVGDIHEPPPKPIYSLDGPEQKLWDDIVREYGLSRGGEILLNIALQSLARARHCSEVIDAQGAVIAGRRNILKPHPLLGVERAARSFCASIFKKLKIDLRRFEDRLN